MNALAGANVPFLFIVDYAQEQSHIEPLDRIDPATCLFQFPKAGNTETAATALARSTAARCAGPIQWDITPPSPAAYRHSFDLVKQNLLAGNSYLTNTHSPGTRHHQSDTGRNIPPLRSLVQAVAERPVRLLLPRNLCPHREGQDKVLPHERHHRRYPARCGTA